MAPELRLKLPEKVLTPVNSHAAESWPQALVLAPFVTVSAPPLSARIALMVFMS